MNSRTLRIYSLAAFVLTGCVAGERHVAHIERSWPAGAIRHIEVHEVDGSINVHAGPASSVTLVADIETRGTRPDRRAENEGMFRTELDGDTLVIGREHDSDFRFPIFRFNERRIRYDISVPPSVELELHTVNGSIRTAGIDGETIAKSVNGSVEIDGSGTNEVQAKTVNGRIEARFAKDFRGATLKSVNGRITAVLPPNASFVGDFTQCNGDFEAAFPLNIHSHPGSRRVSGEVNGGRYELKITTVNGDIKVDNGLPVPPVPPLPATPATPPAIPPAPKT